MKPYNTVLKQLFSLALPIIFSNLINASSGLISMFFIAKINQHSLAAGAIITSSYGLVTLMVVSVLYSVSILIGQSHGAGRNSEISHIIFSGIFVAFILGVPLTYLLCYMTPILRLLHQPLEVSQLVGEYFRGIAYGFIPSLIVAVFTQFFMGISKARLLMNFTIIGVLINSLISYILIFGLNIVAPMGIFGAGLANSITACLLLIIIAYYTIYNSELKKYEIISKKMFNLSYCKLLLKIGMPISIQYTLELLAFSIVTYLMGLVGTNALGAQQITLQCSMVAIMIVMGFSQSGSILVSQSLGKGTFNDRQLITNCTFVVAALFMLGIGLVYCAFPDTLIGFYLNINDPSLSEMLSLARTILCITAFTQLFDAGRNIAAGLLRGYGDTKSSMWTGLTSCWIIGLPLAILFAFILHLNAVGLRLGMMVGILFGCIHLLSRLNKINKASSVSALYQNKPEAV